MRNTYKSLIAKSEGEKPLWRLRLIWEEIITMDLREVG